MGGGQFERAPCGQCGVKNLRISGIVEGTSPSKETGSKNVHVALKSENGLLNPRVNGCNCLTVNRYDESDGFGNT